MSAFPPYRIGQKVCLIADGMPSEVLLGVILYYHTGLGVFYVNWGAPSDAQYKAEDWGKKVGPVKAPVPPPDFLP